MKRHHRSRSLVTIALGAWLAAALPGSLGADSSREPARGPEGDSSPVAVLFASLFAGRAAQSGSLDRRVVGAWRFQKYGPVNGTFDFRQDGTYSYSAQHGRTRLAHEGTYSMRAARQAVPLPGLLGIVRLAPQRVLTEGEPTSLMISHRLMDNHEPREYFVQDNLEARYTQGIPTLSLCDVDRDWPGCVQSTRIYRNSADLRP